MLLMTLETTRDATARARARRATAAQYKRLTTSAPPPLPHDLPTSVAEPHPYCSQRSAHHDAPTKSGAHQWSSRSCRAPSSRSPDDPPPQCTFTVAACSQLRRARLEVEHVRRSVAGLLEVRLACKVEHRRRAAHEDHRLLGRFGKVRLDHLPINEADRVLPWLILWLHVNGVPHLHTMTPFGTVSGIQDALGMQSGCTQRVLRVQSA